MYLVRSRDPIAFRKILPLLEEVMNPEMILVMGKTTWEYLPEDFKQSFSRRIIIVSSTKITLPLGVPLFRKPDEFLEYVEKENNKEFLVVGGTQLYEKFVDYTNEVSVCMVKKVSQALPFYSLSPDFLRTLETDFSLKQPGRIFQESGVAGEFFILYRKDS